MPEVAMDRAPSGSGEILNDLAEGLGDGEERRDHPGDSQRREKSSGDRSSRRRRPGGSSRNSSRPGGSSGHGSSHSNGAAGVETGVDKMTISDEGDERRERERRSHRSREEDERGKRSGSRSRRKPGRPTQKTSDASADPDKKAPPKKTGSFLSRTFNRNKSPPPPADP